MLDSQSFQGGTGSWDHARRAAGVRASVLCALGKERGSVVGHAEQDLAHFENKDERHHDL
jgi:hypothetical protein